MQLYYDHHQEHPVECWTCAHTDDWELVDDVWRCSNCDSELPEWPLSLGS